MKKLNLLMVVVCLCGCLHSEKDAPPKEQINIFQLDSIVNIINSSYQEIGMLPIESEKSTFCTWLEKYKNLINSKILTSPNYDNQEFKIVGYTAFSKDEYFVAYNGCCELANKEEIPERVQKIANKTPGCTIPKENKFEPTAYSNSVSKTHPFSEGPFSLIQVWFNKKQTER